MSQMYYIIFWLVFKETTIRNICFLSLLFFSFISNSHTKNCSLNLYREINLKVRFRLCFSSSSFLCRKNSIYTPKNKINSKIKHCIETDQIVIVTYVNKFVLFVLFFIYKAKLFPMYWNIYFMSSSFIPTDREVRLRWMIRKCFFSVIV